jgi:hypothetical protein
MINHPFSKGIQDQLASIREGVAILEAFAQAYAELKPFSCSPLGPSVYCAASEILTCRNLFGPDGWEQGVHSINKEVAGVRVEVALP